MAAEVKLNSEGIQELLDGGSGVREMLLARAERVLNEAQALAPFDEGDYEASLRIEEDHTDRLAVRVVADVDYAWVVEARDGVLARSLDAAGGA